MSPLLRLSLLVCLFATACQSSSPSDSAADANTALPDAEITRPDAEVGLPDAAVGADFTATYTFDQPSRASCADAGASFVDVYLNGENGEYYSLEDQRCNDETMELINIPFGTYEVTVIAWDIEFWQATTEAMVHSANRPGRATIDLVMLP